MKKHGMIHAFLEAFLAVSLLACASAEGAPPPPQKSLPFCPIIGDWSEQWGTPGETDVTYHDQYRITQTADGGVNVQILHKNQSIFNVRFENNLLTFSQKTDAFVVKYALTLHQSYNLLSGTATTPKKAYDIKWTRVGTSSSSDESAAVSVRSESGTIPSIEGTTWAGTDSDGDYYEYTFLKGGQLRFRTNTSGTFKTWEDDGDVWAQNGSIVVMVVSKYTARQGIISGSRMSGDAWNVTGRRWTWEGVKK